MTHRRLDYAVFGPIAERPTADNPHGGEKHVPRGLYLATDTGQLYESTGQSWQNVGQIGPPSAVTTVTANYTALATDCYIIANAASKTITLPDPAIAGAGTRYIVINGGSGATTTVATAAGAINGAATDTALASNYNVGRYVSDGANWFKF